MYNKNYYDEHKEQWKSNYLKNKSIILRKRKSYYEDNKECLKQSFIEYYENNKEIRKEYQRNYYKNNKKQVLHSNKLWATNNEGNKKLIQQKYNRTEKGKLSRQRVKFNRRTKEKEAINTLTSQGWLDILEEHNYMCAYCGIEFNCENLPTKDHIIPISKGGHNIKENIVPACKSCNCKKHNKILSKEVVFCLD